MDINAIKEILEAQCGKGCIWEVHAHAQPPALKIEPRALRELAHTLQTHPKLYFDHLACITGIDGGAEAGTMEVFYTLYSISYEWHIMLQAVLPRDHPHVPSLTPLWAGADWHEREAFDLLGIHFEGHPDLRRILLPSDWEGHPLRKDYEAQEQYHGMPIRYSEARPD